MSCIASKCSTLVNTNTHIYVYMKIDNYGTQAESKSETVPFNFYGLIVLLNVSENKQMITWSLCYKLISLCSWDCQETFAIQYIIFV